MSHWTCSYIPMYINAVAESVMLYFDIIFITSFLKWNIHYIYTLRVSPPLQNEKFWVRTCLLLSLPWADHLSRGVVPIVVCLKWMWSWSLIRGGHDPESGQSAIEKEKEECKVFNSCLDVHNGPSDEIRKWFKMFRYINTVLFFVYYLLIWVLCWLFYYIFSKIEPSLHKVPR